MPRHILNIGMPKTGTTPLQTVPAKLRTNLERAGAPYPEPIAVSHNIRGVGSCNAFLGR